MASNYPTSLDTFTNPSAGNTLDSPSHSLQHSDINDAVEALETKIGIGDSPAGSATSGQVLTAQGGGTAIWATPTDTSGLAFIETQTLSAVTSVSFSNDIFTSNYDNYLFVAYLGAPSNGQITIRLRSAGSDNATANYDFQYIAANNTVVSGARITGQTSARATYMDTNTKTAFNMTLYNPKVSDVTVYHVESFGGFSGAYIENYIGKFALTTSFDSISFLCAANLTGSISVYGYRK